MSFRRALSQPAVRLGLSKQVSPSFLSRSNPSNISPGLKRCVGLNARDHTWPIYLGDMAKKLGSLEVKDSFSPPCFASFRRLIHSGKPKEAEERSNPRSIDFVRTLVQNTRNDVRGVPTYYRENVEQNADVVHIKILRNNAFVTVTDANGNKKFGVSTGKLTGKGEKTTRYASDTAAEHIGRRVRESGIKSVVVKVNGFTHFRRKRQTILALKEGYSYSRGDQNPVVFIEDTTRKPHNGCRLPKRRRI